MLLGSKAAIKQNKQKIPELSQVSYLNIADGFVFWHIILEKFNLIDHYNLPLLSFKHTVF